MLSLDSGRGDDTCFGQRREANAMGERQLWTVGHSNREIADFLALPQAHGIELVGDVRRFPGSRRQPQLGAAALQESPRAIGCDYRHFPDLGGRRRERLEDSPNVGWRVESFNAYADYMLAEPFKKALGELMEAAGAQRTTVMCAEAVPWRCHRRLIADALVVRGWTVRNILSETRADEHALTRFARLEGDQIHYLASPADETR
jgi:uncharacterized protein (DUF488 family)